MKIGIISATGKAGSVILKEATDRGHEVTAIVRNASKLEDKSLKVLEKDVFDLTAEDVRGFDVVVNAFGAPAGKENLHVEVGQALINILKDAPNTRLIVVGGAGSLFTDESKHYVLLILQVSLMRTKQQPPTRAKTCRTCKRPPAFNGRFSARLDSSIRKACVRVSISQAVM